jgi:hypothetical protein
VVWSEGQQEPGLASRPASFAVKGDSLSSAERTNATRRRIVVGVDGSESSLTALRWAVRQAQLTDAPLEVVSTWQWPVSYSGWETPLPPGPR